MISLVERLTLKHIIADIYSFQQSPLHKKNWIERPVLNVRFKTVSKRHNREHCMMQDGEMEAGLIVPHQIDRLGPALFHKIVKDSTLVASGNVPLTNNKGRNSHEAWTKLTNNWYFVLQNRAKWRYHKSISIEAFTSSKEMEAWGSVTSPSSIAVQTFRGPITLATKERKKKNNRIERQINSKSWTLILHL